MQSNSMRADKMKSSRLDELRRIASEFRNRSILVVGDIMVDRYLWGNVSRISPEAPVPVIELSGESTRLGGAANVARNIVSLGARAKLLGVVGDDEQGKHLICELEKNGISPSLVSVDSSRPTTVKTRIIAHNQQVVRADLESRTDLKEALEEKVIKAIGHNLPGSDVVIVSDYGKGVLTDRVTRFTIGEAKSLHIPVCVDPKETRLLSYAGVTVITPNQHEAGFAYGRRIVDEATLTEVGWGLSSKLGCDGVLITRGEKGMSLFERGGGYTHFPTVAREVFDVTGAGDTVVTAFALALAAGANLREAACISNHAAGIVIKELGTGSTTVDELIESLERNGECDARGFADDSVLSLLDRDRRPQNPGTGKLVEAMDLVRLRAEAREKGQKVVFTNGCFDILHLGHLHYLSRAREMGDMLVVGLNSDASVRRLKGEGRPVIPQADRAAFLCALGSVDYVSIFEEDTPEGLIRQVEPDVLVKGGDYKPDEIVGADFVRERGGKVVVIETLKGRSTQLLIETILKRFAS